MCDMKHLSTLNLSCSPSRRLIVVFEYCSGGGGGVLVILREVIHNKAAGLQTSNLARGHGQSQGPLGALSGTQFGFYGWNTAYRTW